MVNCFPARSLRTQSADQFGAAETAAKALTLQVQALRLENPPYDFDIAFRDAVSGGAQMALVLSTPSFLPHMARVVELANTHRLPSMFIGKHWVQAGGLIAYGADLMFRRTADYVAKILKGAKPADLPVEQPTKFELIVNLNTARALGIAIPNTLLAIADEVIE
jgi:putative ABC transport system substrate-binding protein